MKLNDTNNGQGGSGHEAYSNTLRVIMTWWLHEAQWYIWFDRVTHWMKPSDTVLVITTGRFGTWTSDTYDSTGWLIKWSPVIHVIGQDDSMHEAQWYMWLDRATHFMKPRRILYLWSRQGDLLHDAQWYIWWTGWLSQWSRVIRITDRVIPAMSAVILYKWSCHGDFMKPSDTFFVITTGWLSQWHEA